MRSSRCAEEREESVRVSRVECGSVAAMGEFRGILELGFWMGIWIWIGASLACEEDVVLQRSCRSAFQQSGDASDSYF